MTAPLAGLRVVECSMLGPAAITSSLVDLGAEVIKVEPPAGDYIRAMTWPIVDGVSLMHLHLNRGKRSVALDLRTDAGKRVFRDLARTADVVVEAMRPGALERLGIGPGEAAERQPEAGVREHLRVRRDRPVQGLSEPRRRVRHLGRDRSRRRVDDEGFTYIPEHVSIGIYRRAAVRRAGDPRCGDAGSRDR